MTFSSENSESEEDEKYVEVTRTLAAMELDRKRIKLFERRLSDTSETRKKLRAVDSMIEETQRKFLAENAIFRPVIARRQAKLERQFSELSRAASPEERRWLFVKVAGCRNLPLRSYKRPPNSFVALSLNGKATNTSTKKGDCDPTFDEYFKLRLAKESETLLRLLVFNREKKDVQLLGSVTVDLAELMLDERRLEKAFFINEQHSVLEVDILIV